MWRNLRKGVLMVACAWCLTAVGADDGLRPGQPNELSRSALNITEASAERLGLTFEPAEIEITGPAAQLTLRRQQRPERQLPLPFR